MTPTTKINFTKIREMYMSDNQEDKDIAFKWLCKEIGKRDAIANLLILSFYRDWDDDTDQALDENHYWKMSFKTYPTHWGSNYRYEVTIIAVFDGKEMFNETTDYSRWQVGNGEPKYDFCQILCDEFRRKGVKFYNELFGRQSE